MNAYAKKILGGIWQVRDVQLIADFIGQKLVWKLFWKLFCLDIWIRFELGGTFYGDLCKTIGGEEKARWGSINFKFGGEGGVYCSVLENIFYIFNWGRGHEGQDLEKSFEFARVLRLARTPKTEKNTQTWGVWGWKVLRKVKKAT